MFVYRYEDLRFESRRSPLITRRAAVATSQPLAAHVGLEILQSGGNAADAAVATAAALNVVEPTMTGIGGDCFALYFDAASRAVHAVNGSGRAPAALTLAELKRRGVRGVLPQRSALAVTVPGAAAGVVRHGGSARAPRARRRARPGDRARRGGGSGLAARGLPLGPGGAAP